MGRGQTNIHTHTHFNTVNRPGLRAGSIENTSVGMRVSTSGAVFGLARVMSSFCQQDILVVHCICNVCLVAKTDLLVLYTKYRMLRGLSFSFI